MVFKWFDKYLKQVIGINAINADYAKVKWKSKLFLTDNLKFKKHFHVLHFEIYFREIVLSKFNII